MNSTIVLTRENVTVFLSISIVSVATYRWWKNRTRRSLFAKLPGPQTRWPLIGNIGLLMRKGLPINESALMAFDELSDKFSGEGIFKLDMGPMGVNVYLFRAATVEVVLKSSVNIRKASTYNVYKSWLGECLILGNGDKWRHDRKFLSTLFNYKVLENMVPLINQHSRVLVEILTRTQVVHDVTHKTTGFAFDVIVELLFGVNQGLQINSDNRYHDVLGDAIALTAKRYLNPVLVASDFLYSLTSDGKLQSKKIKELIAYTEAIVIKRKNELVEQKAESGSYGDVNKVTTMIDLLLRSHLENPNLVSLKEIREQLDTFLMAGHETTAVATSFGLMTIANHQEVQDKIHEELGLVFGDDKDRDVTSEDLRMLSYLDCVINEVLRLWTPAPVIARELVEDVSINGYVIPKATDVWIYLRGLHKDPKQFGNPNVFDPDRFLPENSVDRHTFAHLPFSGGLRNCIGYKLALIELKVVFANIFRRLIVKPITLMEDVVCMFETVLQSKEPLAVEFTKRL